MTTGITPAGAGTARRLPGDGQEVEAPPRRFPAAGAAHGHARAQDPAAPRGAAHLDVRTGAPVRAAAPVGGEHRHVLVEVAVVEVHLDDGRVAGAGGGLGGGERGHQRGAVSRNATVPIAPSTRARIATSVPSRAASPTVIISRATSAGGGNLGGDLRGPAGPRAVRPARGGDRLGRGRRRQQGLRAVRSVGVAHRPRDLGQDARPGLPPRLDDLGAPGVDEHHRAPLALDERLAVIDPPQRLKRAPGLSLADHPAPPPRAPSGGATHRLRLAQ